MKYGQICKVLGNGHFDRGKAMMEAVAEESKSLEKKDWDCFPVATKGERDRCAKFAAAAMLAWSNSQGSMDAKH